MESQVVFENLEALFNPKKLNLGALGNMVPQLHIHHIARFESDIAWPGPVWGNTEGKQRSTQETEALVQHLADAFQNNIPHLIVNKKLRSGIGVLSFIYSLLAVNHQSFS